MSFETTLWTGVSALRTAQRQMEVATHNIANVNTPGFSRQRVETEASRPQPGVVGARGDGQLGTGVTITDVIRMRNELTDAAFRNQTASSAGADARAEVLRRAETVLGPVGGGVPVSLSKFWASWDELSLNGSDPAARQGVLDAGNELAGQVRDAAGQLTRLSGDVQLQIGESVGNVNRLAQQAAELNQAIKGAVAANHSPNDLMDKRDQVVDQLVSLTGGIVRPGENGTLNVYVSNRPLVLDESFETMQANTGVPAGATWTVGGEDVTLGGRIGALSELVNTTLPSLRADLDAFAVGLRDMINTAHTAGFDQDGNPGVAFFTGNDASDITVNTTFTTRSVAASATGPVADAGNALSIAGLRTAAAVGASTLSQSIQGLAGRLGGMSSTAQASALAEKEVLNNLTSERTELSSVSTDEELADIVRFQHAYEAAAKVMQVVNECMDTLVNLVRS